MMNNNISLELRDLPVIHSYSRSDAIVDGVLVDVSAMAREAGFRFPVAVTRTVWNRYIVPNAEDIGESEDGRLWDTLFMLHVAIKRSKSESCSIRFSLYYGNQLVELKAVIGPGDQMEPVIRNHIKVNKFDNNFRQILSTLR